MSGTPAITYEGIDHSEHDAQFRKDFHLPGDKVRIDPEIKISGVDMKEVEAAVGNDVLTISKTVMTGKHEQDIVGGERTTVIPQYEFEGVEGRFSAKAFQHELGEFSMGGVIAVRGSEMWAVPMESNGQGEMDRASGPAREVIGFAGKHQDDLHPEGFNGMKAEIAGGERSAIIGDFYARSATSFEDRTGPVNLLASPWHAQASEQETELAHRAIDQAIFEKRVDEVSRDAGALLKGNSWQREDATVPYDVTEMSDAISDRNKDRSIINTGRVLDAAEALLGHLDDRSRSNTKEFDALSNSAEAAAKAGDDLLRNRYSDIGIQPSVARQMESLSADHDKSMEEKKPSTSTAAVRGAALAAQMGRNI